MGDKQQLNHFLAIVRRHARLFMRFRSIDTMKMMEYRLSFLFWVFVNIIWSLFNIFFFSILVGVSGTIGGWNRQEIFLLLGVFTIVDAFTWSIFYANLTEYATDIFDGRLSLLLCRPVNTQFYLMTRKANPQGIFRLSIGVIIIFNSLSQLQLAPSFLMWLLFILFMTISFVFLYSFWFLLTTGAFFFERLENLNEIIPAVRRIWQVPRTAYVGSLGMSLINVIPFLFITSIPSEVLLGQFSYPTLIYYAIITLAIFLLSKRFFNFAVRHYSGMAN